MRFAVLLLALSTSGCSSLGQHTIDASVRDKQQETFDTLVLQSAAVACGDAPRVKALMINAKAEEPLSDSIVSTFNAVEAFVYAYDHPESFYQVCSLIPVDSAFSEKLHAELQSWAMGYRMSERQIDLLKKYRDSVMICLASYIEQQPAIGYTFKHSVIYLNAVEMVPALLHHIELFSDKKDDTELYTLLMLLMKQNNYAPFMETRLFRHLYNEKSSYGASVPRTAESEQQIKELANAFYKAYMVSSYRAG